MGACATKPKADATDAPAPLPEKDEVVSKELTVAATVVETKEVVYAAENSRSLSNLLNESEDVKVSSENDKIQPELVKEEACEAEKDTKISEISLETTSTPTVDAPAELEAEKAIEVEAAPEKTEILVEKAIPVVNVPSKVETEESTPIVCAVSENGADKEIEAASATELQETEAVEEKKIEEHDKAVETPISESVEVEAAGEKTELVEEKAFVPVETSASEILITKAAEETKIEEGKAITEEKNTESEACAENVKP